jgi:hypothetical protein
MQKINRRLERKLKEMAVQAEEEVSTELMIFLLSLSGYSVMKIMIYAEK